jgi:large subunit ribosomal protein L29
MKATELRELTMEELSIKLEDCRKELFNLRFKKAFSQLENTSRIRQIRKDIARILTVQTELKNAK